MNNTVNLASRRRRLCATIVDAVLVPSLTIFLVMVAGVVEDAEDYTSNLWMFWVLLLAICSYLLLNGYGLWRTGQTLGKKLLGIAIVNKPTGDVEPEVAPFWKLICIRALFFPLMFTIVVPTLFVLPLVDHLLIFAASRRCLHDFAASTVVIRLGAESTQAN